MKQERSFLSTEKVREILKDVSTKENIIDPIYEISTGSTKGDGYASFITKVTIKGNNKTLPVIIKSSPKEDMSYMREAIPIRNFFLKEIKYYERIFPEFKKFQDERDVHLFFNAVPRCYKTLDTEFSELLVLEDIKENGFKVFPKKNQMDEAHVKLVLKTYGQLHAISFAMKEHDIDRFNALAEGMEPGKHFTQEIIDMFVKGVEKIGMVFDKDTEAIMYENFAGFKDKVGNFFKKMENYEGKYGVLGHGDCWCNNMMFKYDNENPSAPIDIRLFDFQVGCLTSPVCDLAYFFYVSASQEMLDNFDQYLKVYHDSLKTYLTIMETNVDDHYPFFALKEEWKEYGIYGLILSSCLYRVMLQDDEEIVDLSDHLSAAEVFMKSSRNDALINERYRRIALHFYKNNFL